MLRAHDRQRRRPTAAADLDRAVLLLLEDLIGVRGLVDRDVVGGQTLDVERIAVALQEQDPAVAEIEQDPSRNPPNELLRDIKGG
jgi:hypothetical protein